MSPTTGAFATSGTFSVNSKVIFVNNFTHLCPYTKQSVAKSPPPPPPPPIQMSKRVPAQFLDSTAIWAVVGRVNNAEKPAAQIYEKLVRLGYQPVYKINPRFNPAELQEPNAFASLTEMIPAVRKHTDDNKVVIESKIIVDLVIHPGVGLQVVKEAASLGIKQLFIQPGAESAEILHAAKEAKMDVFEGCVLRDFTQAKL